MSLVVFQNASLGFGGRAIIDGLDLRLAEGDRVGLVGPNGSGKTTLLRLMAGEQTLDTGSVRIRRGLRIGYLPQDLEITGGPTLESFVRDSVPGRSDLERSLEQSERRLRTAEHRDDAEAMMEEAGHVAELHERLAHFESEYSEHEAARILVGLGFQDSDRVRDLGQFSGGWRMRAVLASLLFQRPELLLLDEPTNHLDMPSVAWLSTFMRRYAASFVLITHDREFLDEQISRVVSLEPEGVRQYSGNYHRYRQQRAEEEEVLRNKARNLQREREQAERFIERFRSQASKAKAVQSRIKQLDRLDQVATLETRAVMRFRFPPAERTGNHVLRVEGLKKSFGEIRVIEGADLHVRRGEKIGIIGRNGAGKTTLLRLVSGEISADSGTVRLGHNVTVGYYAQHHADALDGSRSILEELSATDPSAGQTRLRTVAGAFLFRDDEVDKPISVLSGGERARVALARLLLRPGNLLLMDEPTNHLDLESSERLAESLAGFDGTLVFVSHNRAFVRSLATKIWDVADGHVEIYPGTLDEYLARFTSGGSEPPLVTVPRQPPPATRSSSSSRPKRSRAEDKARKRQEAERRSRVNKLLGPLRRKIEELERRVSTLEDEQKARSLLLADPELYGDQERRNRVLSDYQTGAAKLGELTDAWELAQAELEDLDAEAIG